MFGQGRSSFRAHGMGLVAATKHLWFAARCPAYVKAGQLRLHLRLGPSKNRKRNLSRLSSLLLPGAGRQGRASRSWDLPRLRLRKPCDFCCVLLRAETMMPFCGPVRAAIPLLAHFGAVQPWLKVRRSFGERLRFAGSIREPNRYAAGWNRRRARCSRAWPSCHRGVAPWAPGYRRPGPPSPMWRLQWQAAGHAVIVNCCCLLSPPAGGGVSGSWILSSQV
jgi:hypothetical protein